MITYNLEFITPLFSYGMNPNQPEVRVASIRGQLHWWFRALGGVAGDEGKVFGKVRPVAVSSPVVIRVRGVRGQIGERNALIHKERGGANRKPAFVPGTSFELVQTYRGTPLTSELRAQFEDSLEAWLLMGSLGLRTTRAAGNFVWSPGQDNGVPYPSGFSVYEARCQGLLKRNPSRLRCSLLFRIYERAEDARRDVSDTLGGKGDSQGANELGQLRFPLGRANGARKTSPLRFRIVRMPEGYRILAIWDGRGEVTENRTEDLKGIIKLLAERKPALGEQLAASGL